MHSVAISYLAPQELRAHPENAIIFGDPRDCSRWAEIRSSIKKLGIIEAILIKPDKTILSGHLRVAVAKDLKLDKVPTAVVHDVGDYHKEVELLIRMNTDRRQLTPRQIAHAFNRLKSTRPEEGGTKKRRGPKPKGTEGDSRESAHNSRADEEAAAQLDTKPTTARALETVFVTDGVPEELREAVDAGKIAPSTAAKAVRDEVKRQGDQIDNPEPLKVFTESAVAKKSGHETRVEDEIAKFKRDMKELFDLYVKVDSLLTRRPLKSATGMLEYHEFAGLIRDTALRAWREIESVEGETTAGKQMGLTLIAGGKQ
jgi:ParB-like chromosome segregation protein Spo0J